MLILKIPITLYLLFIEKSKNSTRIAESFKKNITLNKSQKKFFKFVRLEDYYTGKG